MINAICELMKISRSGYFKFKREERPIISLLEKYFNKEDLREFIDTGKIVRLENIQNKSGSDGVILNLLIDEAKFSLKTKLDGLFKILGVPDLTKVLPKKLLLKILIELVSKNQISPDNIKERLLEHLKGYQTSLKQLEHPNHVKILYDFIDAKLTKLEVYVLAKNASDYLS